MKHFLWNHKATTLTALPQLFQTLLPITNVEEADIIQKIADAVMLRGPMSRLGYWLDYKLFKNDVYELRGSEVVPHGRQTPQFKVHEVSKWQQVFISFGVPLIVIKFADGRTLELSDKHEDVLRILQRIIPEKELPWKAI